MAESLVPSLRKKIEEGADIVKREAQKIAVSFSRRTAAATRVISDGSGVRVETNGVEAPMARPFEGGIRHPLNYPNQRKNGEQYWGKMPKHPYMELAWEIKRGEMDKKMVEWLDEEARKNFG